MSRPRELPTPVPVEGKAVLITSPIDRSTVAGSVSIVLKLGSQTHQANVFIDGVYLASTPPSDLSWGTTKVANGIHEIDAETFNRPERTSVLTISSL
ncbi:MAG: hypothetical protein ACLQU2_27815 [Candidatus Binataceae bacterium]